jgi:hypothetical protein
LDEPCPAWCTRLHEEDDHLEDRYHQSDPSFVPVVASAGPAVPITDSLTSIDLVVRLCRYVGDVLAWIAVEPLELPQPRMVLTVESARLLTDRLRDQVARYDAD